MVEYFLLSSQGRILNAVSGENLTAAEARKAMCAADYQTITRTVTQAQLREYEQEHPR